MMIEVEIEHDDWLRELPDVAAKVRQAAQAALEGARFEGEAEVTVLLTGDDEVQELNGQFRDKDKPTNVLSFPAPEFAAPHLGDVALAFETCAREAREQGKTLSDHLTHLVVHGVLHLLGWDHETDAEADDMETLERKILAGLGAPDPYAAHDGTDAELRRPE